MGNAGLSDEDTAFWVDKCSTVGELLSELSYSMSNTETPLTAELVRQAYFHILEQSLVANEHVDFWMTQCTTLGQLRDQFNSLKANRGS
jgi:hypothetical protein